MTDQTPTTDAGRRLLDWLHDVYIVTDDLPEVLAIILAIEAEARADALREAAERYRALKFPSPAAVIAILTETER